MIFMSEKMGKILELHHHEIHVEIHNGCPNKTSGIVNFKIKVLKFMANPLHSVIIVISFSDWLSLLLPDLYSHTDDQATGGLLGSVRWVQLKARYVASSGIGL
jgi:hypothetical protein